MSTEETSSLHVRLDRQDCVLAEIRSAIVGNPTMGHVGLATRMNQLEDRVEGHGRKLLFATGALAGFSLLFDWFKGKLFN